MTPAPVTFAKSPRAWLVLAGLALAIGIPARAQSDTSFGRDRTNEIAAPSIPVLRPIQIFFPPNPPPLGQPLPSPTAQPRGRWSAPPAELAEFVNEYFYPPLSTRLASRTLTDKLRTRLTRYRAEKVALQGELGTELERLRDADPEARADALAAFARKQAPELAALEATGEELRRDLIMGEQSWSALREWKLGDKGQRGFSPAEIGQVMRGYAFYENGLLPAQRRLLREIHLEMSAAAGSTAVATAAQPYLFFPPEPARVLLPDDVPAEVAAQLAAYQTKKSRLKKELYDAVVTYEGQKLGFFRANPLKALAESQASALKELDQLAEEIRRGLAQFATPAALAERSPLPPLLQERVAAWMAAQTAAKRDATTRLNQLFAAHRNVPMQTSVRLGEDGLRVAIAPVVSNRDRTKAAEPDPRIADIRAAAEAIATDYGRQAADLINEREAIRTEIARTVDAATAIAANHALTTAMRAAIARETAPRYTDYRIAVFQPGLSPEQRRLLFDGVMERLELPLPAGEMQPTGRAARW